MQAQSQSETAESPFECIIDADTLADLLVGISPLVDECKLNLTESGLEIRAVDPSNVAMADISLATAAFESYEASGGVIGVNLDRLEDIVGMADSGQLIHFELDQETRKLHIELDGLEYTLALIDPDTIRQEPSIPDLDLTAEVTLEGSDLERAITAADMVSDHIELGVRPDDEVFYAHAEGDTDDVEIELGRDELIAFSPGEALSLFSIDYMNDIKGPIDSDAELTLRLGEEFPVKIEMQFADGDGSALWMIAPRISN